MAQEHRQLLKRKLCDVTSVRAEDLRTVPREHSLRREPVTVSLVDPAKSQVICVASGKGGTGKTVFTTNLSVILAREGMRVLLFDADLGLANAHLLLGVSPVYDISQVLSGEKKMKDVIVECPAGVRLMPGGSGFSELSEIKDWRFRYLARRFKEVEADFDMIFVDLSAGISPQVMRFLAATHDIILVTTPDITALIDAYATIKSLANVRKDISVKLIINRARDEEEVGAAYKKLKSIVDKHLNQNPPLPLGERAGPVLSGVEGVRGSIDLALFGWLPRNYYIQHSVMRRTPVALLHQKSFVTRSLNQMAQKIKAEHIKWKSRQNSPERRDPSFFAKLERMVF